MRDLCKALLGVLLTGVLSGSLVPSTGQAQDLHFEHLTVDDGLPSNWVSGILQDHLGFMWFGTEQGLCRYDGYACTVYRHDPEDATSLAQNRTQDIYEDREGTLWVAAGVLHRFERATDSFKRYDLRAGGIVEDRTGALWINGDQIVRFDPVTETFKRYDQDGGVFEDRTGTLWVRYGDMGRHPDDGGGLFRFDPATETFTRYLDARAPDGLLDPRVIALHEDQQGMLWIGTSSAGIHRLDPATGTLTRYLFDPTDPNSLRRPAERNPPADQRAPWVHSFLDGPDGKLWIAIARMGLVRLDPATGAFTYHTQDPNDPFSLNARGPKNIYASREGTMWVDTMMGGVNKVSPGFRRFAYWATFAFLEDAEEMLWVGGADGLLRRDRRTGTTQRFVPNPDENGGAIVTALHEDQAGHLWVGTPRGLYRFDRRAERFIPYRHDPEDGASLSHDAIHAIYEDHEGALWVGTKDGLNRMNRATGTPGSSPGRAFEHFRHDPDDPTSLRHNVVLAITEDRRGQLWVGTKGGLHRFDRDTEAFVPYLIDSTHVGVIYEDQAGRFWIGAWGQGLYLLDRASGATTVYTHADGLPGKNVTAVLEDDVGRLWINTPNGLCWFDPETERFRSVGITLGIVTGDSTFAYNSALKSARGEMFFGGYEGYVSFYPEQHRDNTIAPEVVLTGVRLFDEPLVPGPEAPLQAPAWEAGALTLEHDQNELVFEYVGLHFKDPAENRYQYRLEPYDGAWVDAGTQRSARYTRLPPGDYVFRVTAANSDGVWNEEGASLSITIRPPWWRTTWAYVFYGLLFAGGVFAVDRVQRRRLIRKEREKARARELEQAREIERAYHQLEEAHTHLKATQQQLIHSEKMASLGALTAGIAHEIKNPLNFVNNFAELNEELARELREALDQDDHAMLEELLADLEENAQVITQHGRRADGIVRSMMQHASGGTGEREATDVNGLVAEYVELAYHGKRAQVPGFTVEIEREFDEAASHVEMVPQEIGRVLLNLFSNAFDAVHAQARGEGAHEAKVRVSTRRVEEQVEIRVSDNGPGISEEVRERIFEPFFTTKPPGSGTGLGLSLSYEIVTQGHGGTLTVEGEKGQGATFVITLPKTLPQP